MDIDRRRPETNQAMGQDRATAQIRARELRRGDHIGEPVEIRPRPAEKKRGVRSTPSEPRSRICEVRKVLDLPLETVEGFVANGPLPRTQCDYVQTEAPAPELQQLV